MDMKKFMDAVKEPSRIEKTDAKDMHRFLSIVTEGKNTTTNRLSMAEQMAVQQYTPETKKNITNPVLNVSKDAKPSMIGKYFKAVEEEITEAQERAKDRAKLIAERVISKMHDNTLEQNYNEAVAEDANLNDTDAFKEAVYSWMANEADSSQMAIILNSPYSKKFRKPPAGSSKLYRAIFPRDRDLNSIKSRSEIVAFATKIQGAKEFIRTLDLDPESPESKWVIIEKPLNAADFLLDFSSMARHYGLDEGLEEYEVWMQGTPQYRSANKNEVVQTSEQTSQDEQGVAEGTDPNKLAASVTVDGEFKEFDLTPLIAKNNWVGDPKTVIKQADKWLGDFLRSKGLAYSNLKISYKGMVMNASQTGDADVPMPEFESSELLGRYKKATKKQFDNDEKGVAEGAAETVPMQYAQKVLNHYGADYFKTTHDTLYFSKYRKQFSIGRIRDDDSASAGSVNLSDLNDIVRKLRDMRVPLSPFGEGVAEGLK